MHTKRPSRRNGGSWKKVALACAVVSGVACGPLDQEQANDDGVSTQAAASTAGQCRIEPPFVPGFQPELKWEWTGGTISPEFRNVMMTPVVADVNDDGIPDVIFSAYYNDPDVGILRAISGKDGKDLWAVTDPTLRVRAVSLLAVGDIDNDGKPEICAVPQGNYGLLCFENDGTFKFRASDGWNKWGGPAIADLDGDGQVEIINGNIVMDNTGRKKWTGSDGTGGPGTGTLAIPVDIDGDGKQEIVNDRAIYRYDGTLKCRNTSILHGISAVGNFDADPNGEVVTSWMGHVTLLDDDCREIWTRAVPGTTWDIGAPTIADFDNDGSPDIGVASQNAYTVFRADGSILWQVTTKDSSSAATVATVFDFEGDGKNEVVYADENKLHIFDGATGAVRFEAPHSSGTTWENPLVVDVDGDRAADIVVAENSYYRGIRVYHEKLDRWVSTRKIWNQGAYSVTNVNDDATIPRHPKAPWLAANNTFRANLPGRGYVPQDQWTPAADLTATLTGRACLRDTQKLQLQATITNQGEAATPGSVKVAFYLGNPAAGGTLLAVDTVPLAIQAGETVTRTISITPPNAGSQTIYVVADDDGTGHGTVTECNENNNTAIGIIDTTCIFNTPPVAVCRNVTVNAGPTCQGSASVNNGSYDPDNGPQPLSISEAPQGPFGLGSHSVTLTANDGAATATCEGTVTVVDTTPPAVACVSPAPVECQANSAAVVSYAANATDNCSAVTPSCTVPSGSSFPLGTTPVSCSAQDGSGNTGSCTLAVKVVDTIPPTVTCASPEVVECQGNNSAVVNFNTSAKDSCSAVTPTNCTTASGSQFPVGTTAVTCSAQDTSGNTGSCSLNVRVVDTTPPVVTCPAAQVVECQGNGAVVNYTTSATDSCSTVTNTTCTLPSGSKFPTGTTAVTCSAQDASGNSGSCGFNVTVRDTQPPVPGPSKGFELWPPNHKYVTVKLSDCAPDPVDACGGTLPIDQVGTITGVSSDEVENANGVGDGDSCIDMVIKTNNTVDLRAERDGVNDGRVYTLYYKVTDAAGNATSSSCKVSVPHDQSGRSAVDSGAVYCVGTGCPAGTVGNNPSCKGKDTYSKLSLGRNGPGLLPASPPRTRAAGLPSGSSRPLSFLETSDAASAAAGRRPGPRRCPSARAKARRRRAPRRPAKARGYLRSASPCPAPTQRLAALAPHAAPGAPRSARSSTQRPEPMQSARLDARSRPTAPARESACERRTARRRQKRAPLTRARSRSLRGSPRRARRPQRVQPRVAQPRQHRVS